MESLLVWVLPSWLLWSLTVLPFGLQKGAHHHLWNNLPYCEHRGSQNLCKRTFDCRLVDLWWWCTSQRTVTGMAAAAGEAAARQQPSALGFTNRRRSTQLEFYCGAAGCSFVVVAVVVIVCSMKCHTSQDMSHFLSDKLVGNWNRSPSGCCLTKVAPQSLSKTELDDTGNDLTLVSSGGRCLDTLLDLHPCQRKLP
jgi:hypothetical protein